MDIEEGGGNLEEARAEAFRRAAYYNNIIHHVSTTFRNSTYFFVAPSAERDDDSQIQETAFKFGALATSLSIAGFISVVTGPFGSFQAAAATSSSPTQKKLILASLLSMLASCVSGGALLIVGAVLCRGVALSLPVSYIKAMIAVAVASMAILVCTGLALKLSAI